MLLSFNDALEDAGAGFSRGCLQVIVWASSVSLVAHKGIDIINLSGRDMRDVKYDAIDVLGWSWS